MTQRRLIPHVVLALAVGCGGGAATTDSSGGDAAGGGAGDSAKADTGFPRKVPV